ncbi:MAG: MFS transporter [Spirochaetales bacterium]|nr:MFS transporter [Spirochaetales bacterium]
MKKILKRNTIRSPLTTPVPPGTSAIRLANITLSFRHPNYRLWFLGQLVSLFGTWMQMTAQGFFIYELTTSPLYLGYAAFASGIASWLLMPHGGVVADRVSRRNLLVLTQSLLMLLAFVLWALTFFNIVLAWQIIVLAFFQGIIVAYDAPARQAFVTELVPRQDLTNAIALNSTMFNMATITGPAIGGIIYALFGPAFCFLVNGLSYLAVIIALLFMKLQPRVMPEAKRSFFHDLKEGLAYIISHKVILVIIVLITFISFFGFSTITLLPAWAVSVLHGNEVTNGLLQAARGIGAFLSALTIAALGRFTFRGKLLTLGTFMFPVFLFIFSFTRVLPLSLLLLVGIGASLIFIYNLANSLLQMLVTEKMRGRVMSIYSLTFFGFSPLGGLLLGLIAEKMGEFVTILCCSILIFIFSSALWFFNPAFRRIE